MKADPSWRVKFGINFEYFCNILIVLFPNIFATHSGFSPDPSINVANVAFEQEVSNGRGRTDRL